MSLGPEFIYIFGLRASARRDREYAPEESVNIEADMAVCISWGFLSSGGHPYNESPNILCLYQGPLIFGNSHITWTGTVATLRATHVELVAGTVPSERKSLQAV